MIYFARASTSVITLAEAEHHAIRWFTLRELGDPAWQVPEAIQFYAAEALRRLGPNDS
jgi:hypothetical protein